MEKLKIEDCPNFVKDKNTKAILNTNINEISEYKKQRQMKQDFLTLKEDVSSLKDEIQQIKDILITFLKNK